MTQAGFDSRIGESGFFSRHERSIFCLVAAGLLSVTAVLHFWKLGTAPPGFHSDESSNAYNAYCLVRTGADAEGIGLPLFFRYGDQYQDPVFVYASVPFMGVFGLEKWAARFPNVVFHLLASIAFAFLVHMYCRGNWFALFGGFLFSLIPWVFPVSRTAVGGYTAMLLGMISGWALTMRALEGRSLRCAIAGGAAWALAMYAYHAGRPLSVLMILCLAVAFHHTIIPRWRIWLGVCGGCLCALTPMIVRLCHSPDVLTSRFTNTSIFQDHPSVAESAERFASRYVEYLSPRFLFLAGDTNLRHHTGHGGELFLFLIPFVGAGLYAVVRRWKVDPSSRFLLLGLLTCPAVAALTLDRMHSMRSLNGVIFWLLTAIIGVQFLWQKQGWARALLVAACCAGVIEMGLYLKDYFGEYQLRSRFAFNASLIESLESCFREAGNKQPVYISGSTFALWKIKVSPEFKPTVYVDVLFLSKADPREYQQRGMPSAKVRLYNGTISEPGVLLRCNMRWVETPNDWIPPGATALIQRQGEPAPRLYLYDTNTEPIPSGAELLEIKPIGGAFHYEIYRVQ